MECVCTLCKRIHTGDHGRSLQPFASFWRLNSCCLLPLIHVLSYAIVAFIRKCTRFLQGWLIDIVHSDTVIVLLLGCSTTPWLWYLLVINMRPQPWLGKRLPAELIHRHLWVEQYVGVGTHQLLLPSYPRDYFIVELIPTLWVPVLSASIVVTPAQESFVVHNGKEVINWLVFS